MEGVNIVRVEMDVMEEMEWLLATNLVFSVDTNTPSTSLRRWILLSSTCAKKVLKMYN